MIKAKVPSTMNAVSVFEVGTIILHLSFYCIQFILLNIPNGTGILKQLILQIHTTYITYEYMKFVWP